VAAVLRVGLPDYAREHRLPSHHWRVLRAIMACRTPELGGHLYQCSQCGERQFVPHSCRNRHCPTCQGANGYAWMQAQADALLPVPYFHLVFTLPHALNPLIRQNQARCYDLLFCCAAKTLLEFGRRELQAQLGLTTVLHTWSQTLEGHYHLHCIVTGGGLRVDGRWAGKPPHWLFPVRALSAKFRGKYRAGLQQLYQAGQLEFHGQLQPLAAPAAFGQLICQATRKKWVVYAKRPFAGPEVVLAYLARYTHRVAISSSRLVSLDDRGVTFRWKDYRARGEVPGNAWIKPMTLAAGEFIRRFLLHVLPSGFHRIRHYGLFASGSRSDNIARARELLPTQPPPQPRQDAPTNASEPKTLARPCPCCGGRMIVIERFRRGTTPRHWPPVPTPVFRIDSS
jgi:hypothetical protein